MRKLKPGALRNGAPFKDWLLPASLERVRRKLAGARDGDRQMVDILTAVLSDGLPAVEAACADARCTDPRWDAGCPSCTGYVDALGDLSMLRDRNTSFALVSRAPLAKLEAYKARRGWTFPWFSSYETDFNYDFHVTFDESVAPIEYNFRSKAEYERLGMPFAAEQPSEAHGLSVFFHLDDAVFHTYAAYARGVEGLTDTYSLLDVTPYGRQEDWEDSPPGWPQRPTYGA